MCQLIAGVICYLFWMLFIYFSTDSSQLSSDELRVAVALGVGFGQLAMTGFWLALGFNWSIATFGAIAIVLETLAVIFFSSVSVRFMPPSFFVSIVLACAVHVLLVWGTAKIANRVFRLSLTTARILPPTSMQPAQFRIRDLMFSMVVIAIFASLLQWNRSDISSISSALEFFFLVVCFYYLLSWPSIVACLSRNWTKYLVIAIPTFVLIFLLQCSVFARSFGKGSASWQLIVCLDVPFVSSLIVHSIIARSFGYRFAKTS